MKNRWLIALAAIGIHICIGSVYAWSVLTKPIMQAMGFTLKETTWTFSIAIFGACFILFFIGRFVSGYLLKMKPVETAIFGTGCVFSNNGLLGLPLAIAMLGEKVAPSVSAVLSLNALVLWTLVSIAVEFSLQSGHLTIRSFLKTLASVFKNPLIIAIFCGVAWSFTGLSIPYVINECVFMLSFRNNNAFFNNTVKSNVRSSKCNAGSSHYSSSDKCFFHLSSTPIEVIKLAESSNS